MKQIEINGMVYEFDEKLLWKQEIRVGQNVQLLKKSNYTDKYDLYPGVVTQILPFAGIPVVEVVYIKEDYGSCKIEKTLVREGDEETKIIATVTTLIGITKERCEELLSRKITEAEEELRKAKAGLEYFKKYFGNCVDEITESKEVCVDGSAE